MLEIDCEKTILNITEWIKQIMVTAGFTKLIIGLSGGIDSAVAATLAVRALGKDQVNFLIMPYGKLGKESVNDALLVSKILEIPKKNLFLINIKKPVDEIIKNDKNIDTIRQGNIMSRTRMIYLFDFAKKINALVCGTENKSEHYLGYFTRFGDEASDLEPLKSFYKTQIWKLAKYLGVPRKIIIKAPTADLWENQTDAKELGFSYKDADAVLFYYFEKKLSTDKIVSKGITKEVIIKVLERVAKNDFKQNLPFIF